MDKRRLGAVSPDGFQKIQGADSIGFEILEGNGGRAVVRGLRSGVNDQRGAEFGDDFKNPGAIANVSRVMQIPGDLGFQAAIDPTGVTLRPEEFRAGVTVDARNAEARLTEIDGYFRTNETARTGY